MRCHTSKDAMRNISGVSQSIPSSIQRLRLRLQSQACGSSVGSVLPLRCKSTCSRNPIPNHPSWSTASLSLRNGEGRKENDKANWQGRRRGASTTSSNHSTMVDSIAMDPPPAFHPTNHPTIFTSILKVPSSDVQIHLNPSLSFIGISSPSNHIPHSNPYQIDHLWLRDACRSTGQADGNQVPSIHQSTGQKLFHTADIAQVESSKGESLLDWSNPPKISYSSENLPQLSLHFSPAYPVLNSFSSLFSTQLYRPTQAHKTDLPIDFLLTHSSPHLYRDFHSDVFGIPVPWRSQDMKLPLQQDGRDRYEKPVRLEWKGDLGGTDDGQDLDGHSRIKSNDGLDPNDERDSQVLRNRFEITKALLRDGLVFVKHLDNDRNGSEMGGDGVGKVARLKDLAEIFGEIRSTFYGCLWDVRSISQSKNIAYTNLDLGLHMDLLYFQSPPRFQFLHVLKSKVEGGESIFVDSFSIAEKMWREERELWEVLSEIKVGFWYRNDGRFYRFNHPTFEIDQDEHHQDGNQLANHRANDGKEEKMPRLKAVNYSPPFQSPLPLIASSSHSSSSSSDGSEGLSEEKRKLFFKAFSRFTELSHLKEFRYERKLDEKECVIFDNRRVLHARKGFEWNENENENEGGIARQDGKQAGEGQGQGEGEGEGNGEGEVKRWLKGCYVDGDAVWSSYRILRQKLDL